MDVFEFDDYRKFLNSWLKNQSHQGHGYRSKLAEVAGCQVAYISQVLKNKAHLSPEQAEKISRYIYTNEDSVSYFVFLVLKDRAGTESLKRLFNNKMQKLKDTRSQIKSRVDTKMEMGFESQMKFYSSPLYLAILILMTIPGFDTLEKVSDRLQLTAAKVRDVIDFLISIGYVKEEKGKLTVLNSRFHLPGDSPFITQHHTNWRINAIKHFENMHEESIHYSSVISIAKSDFNIIRENLLKFLEKNKPIIRDSKEEEIYSLCFDFYKI